MPTLPARAAAYTRTGILKRFVEQISASVPARIDNAYAESRLGLKGGDVRAFLQSLRVLGLVDPYGSVTDRARRMRAAAQRPAAMREALQEAYPELVHRWELFGGMGREEIEDFFKVEYGLSTSSAGPAAKLFSDLMREYAPAQTARAYASFPSQRNEAPRAAPERSAPADYVEQAAEPETRRPAPAPAVDVRAAALEAVRSSIKVEINAEWDERRIELVFDRMERLVDRILRGS